MIIHYKKDTNKYDKDINCKNYISAGKSERTYTHCANRCTVTSGSPSFWGNILLTIQHHKSSSGFKLRTNHIYFATCFERR